MMFPYSFYRYPHSNYPYNRYPHVHNPFNNPAYNTQFEQHNKHLNNSIEKEEKKETREKQESPFIEIFGISLYFDDILLICIIFFLFQEGIDDEWLYIALILLLLS